MSICLHIGTHKTGTTSIQTVLSSHHAELLDHGIEFPLMGTSPGRPKAHRYFAAYLNGRIDAPPEHLRRVKEWRPTYPRTIISAEGFSRSEPATVDRARAYFGEDTHVICTLRDPISHMLSHHRQQSTWLPVGSLSDFLATHHAELIHDPANAYYRYDDNIAQWRSAFRVSTLVYEGDRNIVEAFLVEADVRTIISEVGPGLSLQNPSVDSLTAALLRALTRSAETRRRPPAAVRQIRTEVRRRQGRIVEALRDLTVSEVVDFRPFKADFARLNPQWSPLLEGAPDEAVSIAGFTLDDEAVLAIALEAMAHPV